MEIEISKDISNNIEMASEELGIAKEELISRAIRLYLFSIKEQIELRKELRAWELAGMQDIKEFEEHEKRGNLGY